MDNYITRKLKKTTKTYDYFKNNIKINDKKILEKIKKYI